MPDRHRCRYLHSHSGRLTQVDSLVPVRASAGISEKVGSKPVGVEVLGQKLVLFRGSDGTVHCLHGAPTARPPMRRARSASCLRGVWVAVATWNVLSIPRALGSRAWPQGALT